jgi:transposase
MARRYPAAFRTEAVELVRTSGQSIRSLAADLGIAEQTLRNWVRQAAIDARERDGLTTAERDELQRLRRENRLLREEREILKKATAFFARESR